MYSYRFPLYIFVFLFTIASTLPDFEVPSTIKAGTDVQVSRISFIAAESYRLYLGATAPYSEFSPICFLSPKKPTTDLINTFNIPNDVGPPTSYHILIRSWSSKASGGYGISKSNSFALTDTTIANWTTDAEEIYIRLQDNLPCTAFNCERKCVVERNIEHANVTWLSNRQYCRCVRRCPGVVTEDADYGDGCGWEWRWEDEGIDPDTTSGVMSSKVATKSYKTTSSKTRNDFATGLPTISKTSLAIPTASTPPSLGIAYTPSSAPTLSGTASTPSPTKSVAHRTRATYFRFVLFLGIFLVLL